LIGYDQSGNAQIILPFIEAYLLATALQQLPIEAMKYFNPAVEEFDQFAFDIYAELGPDPSVVSAINDALAELALDLAIGEDRPHILLTDEIQPRGLHAVARLDRLQKRLESAFEDVINRRPNKDEKQKMIAIANRVEEEANEARELSKNEMTDAENSAIDKLRQPFNIWSMAVILIGSGSESIPKELKRKLAWHIVEVTAVLMDALFRAFPTSAFNKFRERLGSDEFLRSVSGTDIPVNVNSELRELVQSFLDVYELSLLTLPFRLVVGYLCNAAGQPVLRRTISSVQSDRPLDNLLARVWAAEISAKREREALLGAIQDTPPAAFLRYALYNHLMARVFWTQWEMSDQLALLDAADECLTPLENQRLDKGRLQRRIREMNRKSEKN
jgi:hypothetical protein